MKIISLFTGAGGLDLGFHQVGFKIVWANEFDKTIWDTFKYNFPNTFLDKRSIADVPSNDVPEAIGIIGGPPCQSWSEAGSGRGICDSRGRLFYEYIRILKAKEPLFFLAENVAGILLPKHKEAFQNILAEFKSLNYDVSYFLLDTNDYGVPQNRKRVIIVGYHKKMNKTFSPPQKITPKPVLKDAIGDLKSTKPAKEKNYTNGNEKLNAPNHEYMNGGFSTIYMSRNRVRSWDEPSFTIQAGGRHAPIHPQAPKMKFIEQNKRIFVPEKKKLYRRLSVRECARIQTFPDDFIFIYSNVADGYKMVGNAVPVAFAKQLANVIFKDISEYLIEKNKANKKINMTHMKITKLYVQNFRHITGQTIEFGDKLTVIAGQNSTGKSSLLGWIAQACDFKPKIKTITGKNFQSKYSEIFRFCKQNDYSETYTVSLNYIEENGSEKTKEMKTRHVPKTEKGFERYRVDFDNRGTAIDFPVIYLGLKRLIPLATEGNISPKNIKLEPKEVDFFSKLSKEILILSDKNILSEGIKSTNKEILAMRTADYGHLGNSAGQDNIGQIISALISFKRLKWEQKEKYKGGLILIDEIDATLYAGSQIHLIKELYRFARDNQVQIIFTTHSLEILEHLSEHVGNDTKINFLELSDKKIHNKIAPSITSLINKIKVQTGQIEKIKKIKKIEVLCEDKETELWCKNLLNGQEYKKYLNIEEGPFGEGSLSAMADSKHSIFKEAYFVLDGDCKENYENKKLPPRTIILPGNKPPEIVFYHFLYALKDDDAFWIDTDELNFSKQTCFQDYQNHDLSSAKKWFKDNTFKTLFGSGYSKLFNRWKKDNQSLVNEFQEGFKKMIEK